MRGMAKLQFLGKDASTCPRCRSKKIRRSKKKGALERILAAALTLQPFRCGKCDKRFFRLAEEESGESR